MQLKNASLILCVSLCFAISSANADFVIEGGSETATFTSYLAGFVQGYDFVSETDQVLTALGFWDEGMNGLPGSYELGIWETSSQDLLASVVIDSTDPLDNGLIVENGAWRFEDLGAAVTLSSGTTYTLGFQVGPNELGTIDALFIDFPTLVTNPNVSIDDEIRFLESSDLEFPSETLPAGELFRANINARLAPIPEPNSLAVLLFGVVVGTTIRRR